MKNILFAILILTTMVLWSCDDDPVSSGTSRLIFFAVEGETHFPIHIVVDSDTIGTIKEPAIFSGEYPSPDDTTLIILEIENGMHSYEAFTYNIDGIENFVEAGPYFKGLSNRGSLNTEGFDYYIRLNFEE